MNYSYRSLLVQLRVGLIQFTKQARAVKFMRYIHCISGPFFLLLAASNFSDVEQVFQLISTQPTYTFNITIVNDNIVEGQEDFFINLASVTQVGIIGNSHDMATVNIADDDGQ